MSQTQEVFQNLWSESLIESNIKKKLGAALADKVKMEMFNGKKLSLIVSTQLWQVQVQFHKKQLLDSLRQIYPSLQDIVFRTATQTEKKEYFLEASIKNIRPDIAFSENRMERFLQKMKLIELRRQEFNQKSCEKCGRFFVAKVSASICQLCSQKTQDRYKGKIEKLMQETPWMKYEDLKDLDVSKDEFLQIKHLLKQKSKDQLFRFYFEIKNDLTKKNISKMKEMIQFYVSLKTQLQPHQITDAIVQYAMGSSFYRRMIALE